MSPEEKEAAGYSWLTGPGFGLLFLLVSGALVSARLRLAPLGEAAMQAWSSPHPLVALAMALACALTALTFSARRLAIGICLLAVFWLGMARGLVRCLRVARTLADLEESEGIFRKHVLNALAFRFQNPDPELG